MKKVRKILLVASGVLVGIAVILVNVMILITLLSRSGQPEQDLQQHQSPAPEPESLNHIASDDSTSVFTLNL